MWQCKWERRNAYGVFVGTPERKRLLGRPRLKRENKIKIDLNGDGRTWTGLIYLRIVINREGGVL